MCKNISWSQTELTMLLRSALRSRPSQSYVSYSLHDWGKDSTIYRHKISHSVAAEGVAVLVLSALAVSEVDGSFLFSWLRGYVRWLHI